MCCVVLVLDDAAIWGYNGAAKYVLGEGWVCVDRG
jgi:hypothetical protein